jgi:hypothetical protein
MNAKEILLMKMVEIVFVEKRPFCYAGFLSFEYEGQQYKFEHGTIRNIFSWLHKRGDIEYEYRSGPTFYTLPGIRFGKSITVNHTEGASSSSSSSSSRGGVGGHLSSKQRTFLQIICEIPMDRQAIHDIRLSFTFKHLWSILYANTSPLIKSKDMEIIMILHYNLLR